MSVALTDALAEELSCLDGDEGLELDGHTYYLYEVSEEINDQKYVFWSRIYKRSDGKYFIQHNAKCGSYWSDYEFEYGEELAEVRQVEVRTVQWKSVK